MSKYPKRGKSYWCEACRENFDVDHYADGRHKVGAQYGITGERMENPLRDWPTPLIQQLIGFIGIAYAESAFGPPYALERLVLAEVERRGLKRPEDWARMAEIGIAKEDAAESTEDDGSPAA